MKRYLARALIAILLTLGSLAHVSGIYNYPYVDEVENLLYDTRVRMSAPGGVDDRVVIIAIDEPSLAEHGHWPWTRDKLALLVEQLFAYNVAVVGFDMLFPERDESADVVRGAALETRVDDNGVVGILPDRPAARGPDIVGKGRAGDEEITAPEINAAAEAGRGIAQHLRRRERQRAA